MFGSSRMSAAITGGQVAESLLFCSTRRRHSDCVKRHLPSQLCSGIGGIKLRWVPHQAVTLSARCCGLALNSPPLPLGSDERLPLVQMDLERLQKLGGAVRTGGKGTVRRCVTALAASSFCVLSSWVPGPPRIAP